MSAASSPRPCRAPHEPRRANRDGDRRRARLDAGGAAVASGAPLTPREREIVELMADGANNRIIASRLAISRHTVKFHVASILAKLGARSRTEAVALALRRGLLAV